MYIVLINFRTKKCWQNNGSRKNATNQYRKITTKIIIIKSYNWYLLNVENTDYMRKCNGISSPERERILISIYTDLCALLCVVYTILKY